MSIINILIYAIPGLAFLVLIHELGHLLIARWCGIKVEAFSIFFGRAIYSVKWKEIEWRIGWIPFGGYCKMKGQEDFGEAKKTGDPEEFYERPAWARLFAVLGGPVFNIILGFLLITGLTYMDKMLIIPNSKIITDPSEKSLKLKDGDLIVAVDGEKTNSWNEVNTKLVNGIYKTKQILTVKRNNKTIDIEYIFDKEKRINRNIGFDIAKLLFISKVNKTIEYGKTKDNNKLEKKSPAWNSGLKEGDLIVAVNNKFIYSRYNLFNELNNKNSESKKFLVLEIGKSYIHQITKINGKAINSYNEILSKENLKANQKKQLYKISFQGPNKEYTKNIKLKEVTIKPIKINNTDPVTNKVIARKVIGVNLLGQITPFIKANQYYKEYTFLDSLTEGTKRTWNLMVLAVAQFKLLTQLSGDTVRENLTGPIGIIKVIGEQGSKGFKNYISMIALISLFLGIFNLLPIPAVDGGHILLSLFEIIRRKPLSLKIIQRIQIIGVVIIFSIAILVTINDIFKWFR